MCDQCSEWWCFPCLGLNNDKATNKLISNEQWRCPNCRNRGSTRPEDRQWSLCIICKQTGLLAEKQKDVSQIEWICEKCLSKSGNKSKIRAVPANQRNSSSSSTRSRRKLFETKSSTAENARSAISDFDHISDSEGEGLELLGVQTRNEEGIIVPVKIRVAEYDNEKEKRKVKEAHKDKDAENEYDKERKETGEGVEEDEEDYDQEFDEEGEETGEEDDDEDSDEHKDDDEESEYEYEDENESDKITDFNDNNDGKESDKNKTAEKESDFSEQDSEVGECVDNAENQDDINEEQDADQENELIDVEFDNLLTKYAENDSEKSDESSDSGTDQLHSDTEQVLKSSVAALSSNTIRSLRGDMNMNLGNMTSTGMWSYQIPMEVLSRTEQFTIQSDLWERFIQKRIDFRNFLSAIQNCRMELYKGSKNPFDVLVNPFCEPNIQRHWTNQLTTAKRGRKTNKLLGAIMYCSRRSDGCRMEAKLAINTNLQVEINWSGKRILHNTVSSKTAPSSTKQREEVVQLLEDMPPVRAATKLKKHIPMQLWQTGYRGGYPSLTKLRRIMNEYSQNFFGDQRDESMQLQLLAVKQGMQTPSQTPYSGCVQHISIWPKPFVMCFCEAQIRTFHELKTHDIVYLDATGGIFRASKKSMCYGRPVYIYEIVCRNPYETGSSLPIASMASAAHDTATITFFIQNVLRAEREICGRNARCPLVMCDMSLVLIYSFLSACNQEDMKSYIRRCWRVVNGIAKKSDFRTFVHTCNSHIMKNAKELTNKYYKKNRKFGMFLIGLLIQCKTLKELESVWKNIYVILNNEFITSKVRTCHKFIMNKLKDNDSADESNEIVLSKWQEGKAVLKDVVKNEDEQKIRQSFNEQYENDSLEQDENSYLVDENLSPFAKYLSEATEIIDMVEEDTEPQTKLNSLYSPEFCSRMFKTIVSNIHLSSALLLGDLSRHGTSDAYEWQRKFFARIESVNYRNLCVNNRTQGIVEQTMWDLKWNRKAGSKKFTNLAFWAHSYEKTAVEKCNAFVEDYLLLQQKQKSKGRKELEESFKKKSRSTPKGTYLQPTTEDFPLEKEKKNKDKKTELKSKNTKKKVSEVSNAVKARPKNTTSKKPENQKPVKKSQTKTASQSEQSDDLRTIKYPALERHGMHCWFNASVQLIHLTGLSTDIVLCERQKFHELIFLLEQMVAASRVINRGDELDSDALTFTTTCK